MFHGDFANGIAPWHPAPGTTATGTSTRHLQAPGTAAPGTRHL